MDGSVIILALLALAVFMLVKAGIMRAADARLRARLAPVTAKVTNRGDSPQVSIFVSEDSNGQRTERRDVSYTGSYDYEVGGRRYAGTHESPSPVFTQAQMPPRTITVYYDRHDPSVSRLSATIPDDRPKYFALFGAVVLAVALAIALISNLGTLIPRTE
jgi:hypothetical protein